MSNDLVEFIPHNMQEHDDMLRAIANKHMGAGQGNVSIWVIQALHEAYKRGFGLGYTTAQRGGPMASGAPPVIDASVQENITATLREHLGINILLTAPPAPPPYGEQDHG